MASRHSKRRSRAQKRRRHSMRGGRREEEKKDDAAVAPVEDAEKKADAPAGGLFGMFSGDAKKDEGAAVTSEVEGAPAPTAPTEGATAPPAEGAEEKKEEGGMFSGIMGKKDAPAPTETKKKGKKRRHGKYYTPKQLKEACKRMSSKKRHHKNRPFPMEKRGPAMMSNPYAFGERPMM